MPPERQLSPPLGHATSSGAGLSLAITIRGATTIVSFTAPARNAAAMAVRK